MSAAWRAERGFSMALDVLGGEHQHDSIVVMGRDAPGVIRGFLHFVPSYGRRAMSLSFMRRERETPNGLNAFLIARSVESLRAQGVEGHLPTLGLGRSSRGRGASA